MGATRTIWRRELSATLRSPAGWVLAALFLFITGVLFQVLALGSGDLMLSADVLRKFFWATSGVTIVTAVVMSFWLISFERWNHSLVLLTTSPARDWQIVLGKFLAAATFLVGALALSVYIPLLIKIEGKVSGAQIAVGYLGLVLLGCTSLAIGLFASALARHPLVAGVLAAILNIVMLVLHPLSRRLEEPLRGVVGQLDMWGQHFQGGFMNGVFKLADVVYYVAAIYVFLLLAVKTMEAKRWH